MHSYDCNVKAVIAISFLRVLFGKVRFNVVCLGDFSLFFFLWTLMMAAGLSQKISVSSGN